MEANFNFQELAKLTGESPEVLNFIHTHGGDKAILLYIKSIPSPDETGAAKIKGIYKDFIKKGLGRDRKAIPQMAPEKLKSFLKHFAQKEGVKSVTRKASELKPSQKTENFNDGRIGEMFAAKTWEKEPAIISNDNYIVDGHHRWAAALEKGLDTNIKCYAINLPAAELIKRALATDYTHTSKAVKPTAKKASEPVGLRHKITKVMREFKNGTLRSGNGGKVTDPKQAIKIAYEEYRNA